MYVCNGQIASLVDRQQGVDRVARGPGDVADHHTLFADEPVEQRGFADVGAADDRHAQRPVRLLVRFARQRDALENGFQAVVEFIYPATVLRRHGQRLAQSQLVELVNHRVLAFAVDLVGHEHDGKVALAQQRGDVAVDRRGPRAGVDDEDQGRGLGDRRRRVVVLFIANIATAQPGDPGGDPDIPIDGGIGFLLAAGALYGAKRIYDVKKKINKLE